MTIRTTMPFPGTAGISRRCLLSRIAAATSVAITAPILNTPFRSLAQTPAADQGAMPNTLDAQSSPQFRAVAEALMEQMIATGTPGGVLGILADGREEYAAFGVADISSGAPVTPDTLFEIGSITKTITGTAIMRLVEDGEIDLDATVRSYLPGFLLEQEAVASRVTVRHLLTHTGGWWGDFFTDTGEENDAIARYVEQWLPTFPQIAPLGALFSYNNSGFTLLGRIIEIVSGQPYRSAVQDLVLEPLGLTMSSFAPDEVLAGPHAIGHFTGNGTAEIQEPLFLPRSADPAGGLWSTASDLIRYARFHLGDGSANGARILGRDTLDVMQTIQQPIPLNPETAMGMPWFVVDLPGQRFIMHDGGTFGQGSQLWLAPDRGFAVAMLVNSQPGGALATQTALFEAFKHYLALDFGAAQSATPDPMLTPVAPPPVDPGQYAGRYEVPGSSYELRIVDNVLMLSNASHQLPDQVWPTLRSETPPQIPVEVIAEDLAVVVISGIPQVLGFVRRDDGEIGWATASFRLIPKVGTL